MTGLMRVLLCFVLPSLSAWGATIQATTQYDLSSSGGCCPSAFDQSTVQIASAQATAQATVSRSNYARANAIAEFSPDAGIRLGASSYAGNGTTYDASIGGTVTWAGVQAYAGFFDNITILSGPAESFEWTFSLHGTLTSTPAGCPVINNGPYSWNQCSANLEVLRWRQGVGGERVAHFSAVGGAQAINQLVTVSIPVTVGVAQSVGVALYASSICDGGLLPPYRNCESLSDFDNTATLVGFHVLDTQGNVVDNNVVLQTESGFDYFSVNVPEPSSFLLLLSGLVVVLSRRFPSSTRA